MTDPYIGVQPIPNYYLTEKVGQGRIGSVYRAERTDPADLMACKVIPEGKLKLGWQREVEKLARLRGVPNVVPYHSHGDAQDLNHRPFTFVLFDFIEGQDLRQYLENSPSPMDLAFVEGIARVLLSVLHACRSVEISHGDLHEGNILISKPDPRLPGSPRTVWVSDFGYGGSHNDVQPKDDYRQMASIVLGLLGKLTHAELNSRDKLLSHSLADFFRKKVIEVDATQGSYVGNPELLLREIDELTHAADRQSAAAAKGDEIKGPGDYLWAEALGYRVDEWKNLFVPEFLAAQDLLNRNITILTGARGCGKTMAFRRLTAFMDRVIGEPSGVKGADHFVGFYLNCRDLAEAFPWVPPSRSVAMAQQLIHYFHLAWLTELCKTLGVAEPSVTGSLVWLDQLLTRTFPGKYEPLPRGMNVLAHVSAFLEVEKERCRLGELGKLRGLEAWPLARLDFLDMVQNGLEVNVPWVGEKPLYFFLDDYTIPIVPSEVQRILNPIIFKRRSKLFFKVSTEAANSFERQGLRGKPLEIHQDFGLIDLATESLHQDEAAKTHLLDRIFRPRIDRHPSLKGRGLGLSDLLGHFPISNNELAKQMRATHKHRHRGRRVLYHGVEAFAGMWTSDIRTMIQMFVEMIRESNGGTEGLPLPIAPPTQDKCYRSKGGEFLVFAESITDATGSPPLAASTTKRFRLGEHLRNVAEAFIRISRYELTKGDLISNQGRLNPRQAFRLEITDKFDLPEDVLPYYTALVRWHIFLQDWRGKSVRGMLTPRLYLNRVLIPYASLTFSSHDNIQFTNEQFIALLNAPKFSLKVWKKKKGRVVTPTLWDGFGEEVN